MEKNKVLLTAGVFILLAMSNGLTYYLSEGDTAYFCEDKNIVGICFKLSKVNSAGLQTRCYYNESAPTKYKNCKSGWDLFEEAIIGFELNDTNESILNDSNDNTTKDNIGIIDLEIGECITYDNITCKSRIYQKGVINKDIEINCAGLNSSEIQDKLIVKTLELLDSISDIQESRKQKDCNLLSGSIVMTYQGRDNTTKLKNITR